MMFPAKMSIASLKIITRTWHQEFCFLKFSYTVKLFLGFLLIQDGSVGCACEVLWEVDSQEPETVPLLPLSSTDVDGRACLSPFL